ncbi:saccharopine dehydrogenase C-terminal domain-containing protein [Lentzea sp. NPDC051208]|uniref:saccharopine dehydrogenase family protein n=1 Tax=Lentzea sp. NPDC051208 TaxID=3154642 RepID=UPI003432ED53
MRVTLLGCGRMGRGAGYALARDPRTTSITLVDRDHEQARELAAWLSAHAACEVRVGGTDAIAGSDAVAAAVPWAATRTAIELAARAKVPVASITRPPQESTVDELARAAGVPVLLPVGLEPGLTELAAADVARRLTDLTGGVRTLEVFCGGVPATPRKPWGYTAFFGGELANHLPIAQRSSLAVEHGQVVGHPRFSGVEERHVPGVGLLEAYHDGMVPWLADHPALAHADCTQKTLRWPGFAQAVTGLATLGLLDEAPVAVDGVAVAPKRVVEHVLAPQLRARPEDEDVVVLEVSGTGLPDAGGTTLSIRALLVDRADPETGLAAMTRTTGFTLAAATVLLAERAVAGTGWLRPHLALSAGHFARIRDDLAALGVRWTADGEGRHTPPQSPSGVASGGSDS